jgi:chromosome segregation ATPase
VLQRLEASHTELKADYERLKTDNAELKQGNEALMTSNADLRASMEGMRKEMADVKAQLADTKTQLAEVVSFTSKLSSDIVWTRLRFRKGITSILRLSACEVNQPVIISQSTHGPHDEHG